MSLRLDYEIRDPIHGLIGLTEQERKIINTPIFQRLRRIRQLALADLVYPGALHTRFEHSLGTMHVASRVFTHLAETERLYDTDHVMVRLPAYYTTSVMALSAMLQNISSIATTNLVRSVLPFIARRSTRS